MWVATNILAGAVLSAPLSAQSRLAGAPDLLLREAAWDSIGAVSRTLADSVLINPLQLVFLDSVAVVVDFGDRAVKGFSQSGRHLWTYAKPGRGPAEIAAPAAMSVDSRGRGWLADRGTGRAYAFSSAGRLVESVTLGQMAERAVALGDQSLLVVPSLDSGLFVFPYSGGQARVPRRLADGRLTASAGRMARAGAFVVGLPGGRAAVAFADASVVALVSASGTITERVGPIGQPFPGVNRVAIGGGRFREVPDAPNGPVAVDISASGGLLYVQSTLVRKRTSRGEAVSRIDVYDANSGIYAHSIDAPVAAEQVAIRGDIAAFLRRDPEPSISFWRFRVR